MKRRHVVVGALGLGGIGRSPAQGRGAPGKIGFVHQRTVAPDSPTVAILRPAWQRLGYVEGETMLLRSADGDVRRMPQIVAELVALKVGVLIVVGGAAVRAASQATKTMPIVAIDLETDPVRAGG